MKDGWHALVEDGWHALVKDGLVGWMPHNMALDQDDENVGYRPPRHRPGQSWQQASQDEDDGVMFDEEDEWVGVSRGHCCAISGHPIL